MPNDEHADSGEYYLYARREPSDQSEYLPFHKIKGRQAAERVAAALNRICPGRDIKPIPTDSHDADKQLLIEHMLDMYKSPSGEALDVDPATQSLMFLSSQAASLATKVYQQSNQGSCCDGQQNLFAMRDTGTSGEESLGQPASLPPHRDANPKAARDTIAAAWTIPMPLKHWAHVFSKSRNTVNSWFKTGQVKAKKVGRSWAVDTSELPADYKDHN